MKKLALLLGALSLVSSVAYAKEVVPAVEEVVVVEEAAPVAAPALRVTNFGQFIEVDNNAVKWMVILVRCNGLDIKLG